jgi:hypothetical protein
MLNQRHILYLQPSELFGGAERQIAAVLPQLEKQGVAVTALVGPGHTIVDWLESAGVRDVVHSPSFPRDMSDARGFARLARAREFVARAHVIEREVDHRAASRRRGDRRDGVLVGVGDARRAPQGRPHHLAGGGHGAVEPGARAPPAVGPEEPT